MGTLQDTVVDILRGIAASLQFFLPATFLVGALIWLLPFFEITGTPVEIVAGVLAIVAALYLLQSFNGTVIGWLRGDNWPDTRLVRLLTAYQLKTFYRYRARTRTYSDKIVEIDKKINELQFERRLDSSTKKQLESWRTMWEYQLSREQVNLENWYPPESYQVQPTRFGNAFAAFENYPVSRYGINYNSLWPLFWPVLVEKKYTVFIDNAKASLDFFVNLLVVSGIVWFVALGVFALSGRIDAAALVLLLPLFAYLFCYRAACIAVVNWGITVKAAFDLYRSDLMDALKLQLPFDATILQERYMWRNISYFLTRGEF